MVTDDNYNYTCRYIDGYIEITDPKQFDGMTRHQKFIITCKKCGKRQKHELFMRDCLPTYLKFLCTKCAHSDSMMGNQNGYKKETHAETHITDPKQFDTMVSKRPYSYSYNCIRCGKLQHVRSFDPRKIESNKHLLCNICSKSRLVYDNMSFDSSWELAVWIYAKDHDIAIEREPVKLSFKFDDTIKHVIPDFRYNGTLVEIKGDQYYNRRLGASIYPYKFRSAGVPIEEPELNRRKRLLKAKFMCYKDHGVEIWGKEECKPFLDYIDDTYGPGYLLQFRVR